MGARPLVFENPVVFRNDLKALCLFAFGYFVRKFGMLITEGRKSEERLFCVALLFGVF